MEKIFQRFESFTYAKTRYCAEIVCIIKYFANRIQVY